nr:leucine-rich repeat extensin-like protein 3 [Arachis hypogaea]
MGAGRQDENRLPVSLFRRKSASGSLFLVQSWTAAKEIDLPYIHKNPVRGEYYIYCAVPRIRNYVVHGRPFQYPIRTAYFNPDAPYDFPLSWLHPGGPGIPHPKEQMPPPPDYRPPPEPPLPDGPIPAQPIREAPPAPFVLDEWGVPVSPPELDPLPEPIEPPVFDEQ